MSQASDQRRFGAWEFYQQIWRQPLCSCDPLQRSTTFSDESSCVWWTKSGLNRLPLKEHAESKWVSKNYKRSAKPLCVSSILTRASNKIFTFIWLLCY